MEHRGSLQASTSGRGLEGSVPHVFTPGLCQRRQRRRLREFEHLCRGLADKGTKSRAIAITWEDMAELEGFSTGEWGDSEAPAQARPDSRPASVLPASRAKPLKINRDLLLYRAKILRQRAARDHNLLDRMELHKEAEALLRKCLAMDATDARAHVALGRLLVQQRRYDEARALYEEGSTATGGQNEYVWQSWAMLESRCGNVGQARKLFDAALVANRGHAAAWHGWGLMEKRQGNLLKAKDIWVKGIRATQDRPNPFLYQSIAMLAGEMGYIEEARQWFREGTSTLKGKRSLALWHGWAVMEATKGEKSAVRYLFRKGLEVNSRSRYVHLSWGIFERDNGQVDNARELFKRGHLLNPQDAPILQAWAVMEWKEGNVDTARQLFETGSRADPHHLHIWQAWGVLEHREGNLNRAREMFQQAVWAQPKGKDVAIVWQAWGVLEAGEGNIQLARQLFKCAVKADSTSEASWLAWAAMEEEVGALQRATELRSFRMQGINDVVLPANFGISLSQEPADSPLKAVANTMREWFSKVETARSVAQRPAPSYMRFREGADEDQEDLEEVPSLQEMQKYNTSELQLPQVPLSQGGTMMKAKPTRIPSWAATPRRN